MHLTRNRHENSKILNALMPIQDILKFAVENTIQHGSELTAKGIYTYQNSLQNSLDVKFSLRETDEYFYLVVIKPQIKPFPKSIEKEFLVGEFADVDDSERVDYRGGHGLAHVGMSLEFEKLPQPSFNPKK
ncbi:MAG: hypothetical protein JNL11_00205 [Bdellovibrionaceae bacterium]|nr:hypothetical protein [Pseudobdellovibrionaceae bacterium]